jgi:transcriptional regulator with XRE-family HTH domain
MAITSKLITGSEFRKLRVSKKITMYRLVQLTGLNRRTIEQFEREETSPWISTYQKLIQAVETYNAEANANG